MRLATSFYKLLLFNRTVNTWRFLNGHRSATPLFFNSDPKNQLAIILFKWPFPEVIGADPRKFSSQIIDFRSNIPYDRTQKMSRIYRTPGLNEDDWWTPAWRLKAV